MKENATDKGRESRWRLTLDLTSAQALALLGGGENNPELRPEVHIYFYDRLWRLASCHERTGNTRRAAELKQRALRHWELAGRGPVPPSAIAALRPPRPSIRTFAFGVEPEDTSDDAA